MADHHNRGRFAAGRWIGRQAEITLPSRRHVCCVMSLLRYDILHFRLSLSRFRLSSPLELVVPVAGRSIFELRRGGIWTVGLFN